LEQLLPLRLHLVLVSGSATQLAFSPGIVLRLLVQSIQISFPLSQDVLMIQKQPCAEVAEPPIYHEIGIAVDKRGGSRIARGTLVD
jgi:hypothetical protein